MIEVNSYSLWVSNLPNFTVPALNNMVINSFNLPQQSSELFTSLGYVTLLLVIGMILFICVITFFILQFFCKCFSDENVKYISCERVSGKILTVAVLVSIVIYSGLSLAFYFSYEARVWDAIDTTVEELNVKSEYISSLTSDLTNVNVNVTNISMPEIFRNIQNATLELNAALTSEELKEGKIIQSWGPIILVSLLVILSILGILAVAKEIRVILAIVAFFFFLIFTVQLVLTLSTTGITFVFSDVCSTGIDNHTKQLINVVIQDDCAKDVITEIIFCQADKTQCSPFDDLSKWINESQKDVEKEMETSNDPELEKALQLLQAASTDLVHLRECRYNQFQNITSNICNGGTMNLVLLSTVWQDITALLFIYMMVTLYTWNRIKATNSFTKVPLSDLNDLSSDSGKVNTMVIDQLKESGCSFGCFSFMTIMLIIWGALIASTILIFIFGTPTTSVPRA
eukprot:TRINITY_DN11643_c0_g1_i1.p1 TRINITY_DN11643_c0_g1~~TRINITY_DN11643_c0_g1_i1.p1  ORF type:complete len:457 (-),score=81.23 TRINITY_DN11643_c0_g1_i1:23-1393(-)